MVTLDDAREIVAGLERANEALHLHGTAATTDCNNGTAVRLIAVTGATHSWMGHANSNPGLVGEPYFGLDASVVILEFLLNHPRCL